LVLPFWYRLTQVVLEKRPLNGCCVVVVLAYPGFPGKDAIMWVYSSCMVVVPTAWTAGFTAEVLQH